jgi:hypothetical protein
VSCLPVAGLTRLRGPPLPEYSPSLPKAFRTRPLYPRTYLWLVLRASAAHHCRSTHLRFRRLSVHGPCTLVLTCGWSYAPPRPTTAGVLTFASEGFPFTALAPSCLLVAGLTRPQGQPNNYRQLGHDSQAWCTTVPCATVRLSMQLPSSWARITSLVNNCAM